MVHRGGSRGRRRTPDAIVALTVGLAVALAVVLRAPFLGDAPYPDEGGLLVVARGWHTGGPFLYGDLFVDRPPLLVLYFRLGAALGGITPVRVLGLGLVAAAIVLGARAGGLLGGRRGAVAAALVVSALLADPALGTREIDAETVALPMTLGAAVSLLEATRRTTQRRPWWLATGGALAVGALLVKQNLAEALAFGLVLVIGSAPATGGRRPAYAALGWFTLGAAVPLTATLVWAVAATPGLHELGYTLYGFRLAGSQALLDTRTSSQGGRLLQLLWAAVETGLVPVVLASLWLLRRGLARDPVRLALLAMLVVAVLGAAGGGYYWTHYLIALVPVTGLLAALAVGTAPRSTIVWVLVVATLASTLVATANAVRHRTPAGETWVGGTTTWLRSTQQPGDSVVVLYGEAALYETSGARPVYPYLWTLPMRVLDPRLAHLRDLLAGPGAPTFVIVRSPLNAWGIDPHGRLQHTIERHYRNVAVVCGSPVYRRRGVERVIAPAPPGCT